MSHIRRWRESGHLDRAVETAGGREAFEATLGQMLDEARGWRLAVMRKRRGLTPRPGNVAALGGTLKLIADFGDEQLNVTHGADRYARPSSSRKTIMYSGSMSPLGYNFIHDSPGLADRRVDRSYRRS